MAETPEKNAGKADVGSSAVSRPLTEDEKIVHILNRLAFGPRPGDVQKVKAMGIQSYLDQQLTPERVDDTATQQKLTAYAMLQLNDEQLSAMYQARTLAYAKERKLRKQLISKTTQGEGNANMPTTPDAGIDAAAAPKAKKNVLAMADPQERQELMAARQELMQAAMPIAQAQEQLVDAKMLRAIESERQLQEVLVDFWSNHFNIDIRKQSCGILKIGDDRDTIRPHVLGKFRDLLGASAKSPAMLVYLDNFQSTSATAPTAGGMRPGMLMRRRALAANRGLNGQAVGGQMPAANLPASQPAKPKRGGLNENYAREIMELHTLGVDGGYTQHDVTEVARCFTGWGIGRAGVARMGGKGKIGQTGGFQFHPFLHDNGEKTVLGQTIPAGGGIMDGEKVLDILASNPATMRHISTQLCQRLVSDNPPASLVDKCVATWKRTDGDLREVVRAIVTAPEFYAPAVVKSKIKSPFEYAVSAARALGGAYENPLAANGRQRLNIKPPQGGGYLYLDTTSLVGQVGTMGQPLFQYQAPTGYPEESQKWVSSGALISRMNFALSLTTGKLKDVKLPGLDQTVSSFQNPNQFIDRFAGEILHSRVTPATRATLLKQVSALSAPGLSEAAQTADTATASRTSASRMAALLLGSPEFQRR